MQRSRAQISRKSLSTALRAVLFAIVFLSAVIPSWAKRVVTDEEGRTVTLPDRVTRVISLTPSVTDTIYAVGGAPHLIAITNYTFYPPQASKEKPSIGDILSPSLERIASMRPDVVIAVSTLNSPDTVRGLERMGIPVYLVQGRGLAGVYRTVESVGRVLGREKEAAALVRQLREREQRIREQSQNARRPAVFLVLSIDPCITAGRGAFITEMIVAAGARSITEDLAQDWMRVSLEAMIPRKPEFLLMMMDAPFQLKDLQSRPGWNTMEAVRRGRLLRVDDRLQVPGPVAFDGLEQFARQLRAAERR